MAAFTLSTTAVLRRGLCAVLAATAAGGVGALALSATPATAASDPCAASSIAKTVGTVATNTGTYLDSHPQTNQALTTISRQQAGPQTVAALKTYFDANPDAAKDLQTLQQPLTSLSTQCTLPVSLPQLLGLLQSAQAGGLPGAGQSTIPGVATPLPGVTTAQQVAGTQVPSSGGPLPGPAAVTTR
ncbi:hemophore [Mycolicibacterium sp. BK556]|uniref:hemophore n=1 Tax=unclassified Mycolicibacterium TaxID=2636767 RepID=UPI00161EB944|nr:MULTISPECIES: hemophore [unclassified Mycolicibacterium]MBB3600768.1 hemophore [Mycolicibacterium sp. BK556]MBB3630522.1 hemophore [Mycolicibacterium sp. BK607]MBB3748513.1 hemophore [Mycolicibacterium sp. BK634]